MSGIRGSNTRPELLIRKLLHQRGFRYKLHDPALPGKPDLVFPKYRAIILINGCFWHGHKCHLFKWPATRVDFWKEKIRGNIRRDDMNLSACKATGWRICIVWECVIKGKTRIPPDIVINRLEKWLLHGRRDLIIP